MGVALGAAVATALLALLSGLTGRAAAQAPVDLTFIDGRPGGFQYPITVALSQLIEELPEVGRVTVQLGGGASNIIAVNQGQAHLGFTDALSAVNGYLGRPPYQEPAANMVQLFALHPFKMVVIVPRTSPIRTVADLRGKRVNTAPPGFTTGVLAEMVFRTYGLGPADLRQERLVITDAVEQFKDGHLDALFYTNSDLFAPFIDLAQARDIRLLELEEEKLQALLAQHPSFYVAPFPVRSGMYRGLDRPVRTLAYPNTVVARKNLPDELAYRIVGTVAEHFGRIQQVDPSLELMPVEQMGQDIGVPYHPGALRYYRERGWVK